MNEHTFVVVMAGGGGTRLWPKSRDSQPKQFLKLLGDKTMIQTTAERARVHSDWDRIVVVTNQNHVSTLQKQLPELPKENILAEPQKKDTAMAMLAGALYAYAHDPQAVIINCASDHIVLNYPEYKKVMNTAVKVASESDVLVTVGINPTYPEVGFGYIKIGEPITNVKRDLPVFEVDSFTEKPNATVAKAFLATGKYFWNANMYVWSAATLIQAFKKHQPKTYKLIEPLLKLSPAKLLKALPKIYEEVDSISIDYAISEKADNLVLIPGNFGWSDIGDWKVVHELNKKDFAGNVYLTEDDDVKLLSISSKNNMVSANGKLVALYGVEDLIVVDTDEILMVVPKSESQNVKKLVERLKEEKKKGYL
jgi:mannose-1-phosphate guanylyltransferase